MVTVVDHCPKGHALAGANLYEERAGNGNIRKRCKACRRDQRNQQRRRQKVLNAFGGRIPEAWQRRPVELDIPDEDLGVELDNPVECLYPYFFCGRPQIEMAESMWRSGHAREILERAGMSGKRFAREIGVNSATVAYWLRGESAPSRRYQKPATVMLMSLAEDNEDDDAKLTAHGYEPSLEGSRRWLRDIGTDMFCGGLLGGCPVCAELPPHIAVQGHTHGGPALGCAACDAEYGTTDDETVLPPEQVDTTVEPERVIPTYTR